MNFAVYLFPLHFWYGCSRCRMLLSISCKIFYFSRLSPVHYWFTFPWHRDWKQVKCWIIRVMKEKIRTFHQIYFSLWMENHARTKDVGNSLYHVMFIQLFFVLLRQMRCSYPPSDGICIHFSPFVLWIWCFCLARVSTRGKVRVLEIKVWKPES